MDIFLAEPRGFCAGVRRAIAIVENALVQYGAPIYVRHEIVHNRHVIEDLTRKGVIFIEEMNQADPKRPLIFSAHGVSQEVVKSAQDAGLFTIDATCPLVEKVHRQVRKFFEQKCEIIVIGKKEHPEIIGTIGQVPVSALLHVIYSLDEAKSLEIKHPENVGFVTQTTLSTDDTLEIIHCLKQRFPKIQGLPKADICYATTNRQTAVKELVKKTPNIIILGSKNSSNSRHLQETALKAGAQNAWLADDYTELDWEKISTFSSLGISAGASAPEYLVEDLLQELEKRYHNINKSYVTVVKENINFKLSF